MSPETPAAIPVWLDGIKLSEPDELAGDIIEDLEAGLNSFRLIANPLQ